MKLKNIALTAILASSQLGWAQANQINTAGAPAQQAFSASQKKEIEELVANYLVQNPEILVKASQALQEKQQKEMQVQANQFIKENSAQLLNEKIAVAGSKNPNVTIVEFFDYSCGHCIKMSSVMSELIKTNPNVRVIYREFPIFGEKSINASKAALAAGLQGKYNEMHETLFATKNIDDKAITAAATKLKLNMAKFQADMKSKEVAENLAQNRQLAEKMKLFGTPVFIVMSTPNGQANDAVHSVMIPGSTSLSNLQNVVKTVAEAK
jgi:protein-disulfide isomerase